MNSPLFVLTSDLGTGSAASAQLKAVLLAAIPDARVVDLSHDVAPLSIRHAELLLRKTALMFPAGTIHLIIVDPEAGMERRLLAARAHHQFFLAPDNGVLGVAMSDPEAKFASLDREELWLHPVSNTFQGRDILGPVAAALAQGRSLEEVGTPIDDPKPSGIPKVQRKDSRTLLGESLGADRFGNLLTNIPWELDGLKPGEGWLFEVGGQTVPFRRTYMAAKIGRLIVTHGADGFLEIAVTQGSAAERLGKAEGNEIYCMTKG